MQKKKKERKYIWFVNDRPMKILNLRGHFVYKKKKKKSYPVKWHFRTTSFLQKLREIYSLK